MSYVCRVNSIYLLYKLQLLKCQFCHMYAWMSKKMRTFVDLVIFPLALFSELGPFGHLMIYQELGN